MPVESGFYKLLSILIFDFCNSSYDLTMMNLAGTH